MSYTPTRHKKFKAWGKKVIHSVSQKELLERVVHSLLNNKEKPIYWEDRTVLLLSVPTDKTSRYIMERNLAELEGEATKNGFRRAGSTP